LRVGTQRTAPDTVNRIVGSVLIGPAVGEVTNLIGRVLNSSGEPVRNVVVEIWQVDNGGLYLHSAG
jgi:protocatechuate 3,4-dioxygenase beta subunit